MARRVLWLALDTDAGSASLYVRRPKRVERPAEPAVPGRPCNGDCGNAGCMLEVGGTPARTEGVEYRGKEAFSFCVDGLHEAGVNIAEGGLIKISLEVVK